MSEPEKARVVRRWLRYAEEDLRAARDLLHSEDRVARHPCWLAQQAAEKAIKAALIYLQVDFPFVHDLDRLRGLLPDDWLAKREHPDFSFLSQWSVEARYPSGMPDAAAEDAERAIEQAASVVTDMRKELEERGFDLEA